MVAAGPHAEGEKERHEQAVFREFLAAAGHSADPTTTASRPPPEPDIRCELAGRGLVYFEVARILDPAWPTSRGQAVLQAPKPVTVDPKRFGLPEREVLKRKLAKTYETGGAPVELLLYFDSEGLLYGELPPVEFSVHASYVMEPLLRRSLGPFRRIWVFDRLNRSVLWRYPG